jgi:hypothetical protein
MGHARTRIEVSMSDEQLHQHLDDLAGSVQVLSIWKISACSSPRAP